MHPVTHGVFSRIDTYPPLSPEEKQVEPVEQPATRLFFIDNIRWTMIILVVSMHAADT